MIFGHRVDYAPTNGKPAFLLLCFCPRDMKPTIIVPENRKQTGFPFIVLRLSSMRIRFRASDFGLVAIFFLIRAKSKQASCAEMVLGSFVFFLV